VSEHFCSYCCCRLSRCTFRDALFATRFFGSTPQHLASVLALVCKAGDVIDGIIFLRRKRVAQQIDAVSGFIVTAGICPVTVP
jgi:hypothetical protein